MVSSPITSWQIDGEKMETMIDFIFLCSTVTVDNDCSHEIKRHLLLGRKAVTKLDGVLKKTETSICNPYSQSYVFSKNHDKTWSTGEGNGKPFPSVFLLQYSILQYSCLENPMNSMKSKKIGH